MVFAVLSITVYVYVYVVINTNKCLVWVERSGSFYHGFPWSSSGYQVEPSHFPCLVCLRNIKLVCTVSQNDVGSASSSDVVGRKGKPFSSWY